MKLKNLGIAVVAVLALSAVMATSAFATPTTTKSQWYVNGAKLASGSTKVVKTKIKSAAIELKGEVGEAPKTPITLKATGVNCVECVIKQEGSGATGAAKDSGKLEFTGVSVVTPAGCSVVSPITTKPLSTELYMDTANANTTYDRFEPTAGATEKFATIEITGCSIAGSYAAKGFVYGLANRVTGEFATTQVLTFNSTTNGFGGLTLASNPATITGEVTNELSTGESFGAKTE